MKSAWLIPILLVAFAGCKPESKPSAAAPAPAAPGTNAYFVQGVVMELKPDGKTALIQHEEIPGYMQAMTMPLTVKETNELANIKEGDKISFRMLVTETDGWIDQVKKLPGPLVKDWSTNSRPAVRRVRYVEPLQVGDLIPDSVWTNELSQPVKFSDHRGKALAITFIYTRCPFPLFCPKMSSNFTELQQKMLGTSGAPTNWHLFELTFDPDFDTLAVLQGYARRFHADPKHWNMLTGAMIDIDALTEQFGLMFPRGDTGFDHNLRTVVVDTNGKVSKVFNANEWKVDALYEAMVKAAQVPGTNAPAAKP